MDSNQQTQSNPLSQLSQPTNSPSKSKLKIFIAIFAVAILLISIGGYMLRKTKFSKPTSTQDSVYSPASIPTIPSTSASAITSPPPSMDGINTHTELYSGTGADQNLITLGPRVDSYSRSTPYPGKRGFEFELESKTPLLAPMDMTLTGFQNNSTESGIG